MTRDRPSHGAVPCPSIDLNWRARTRPGIRSAARRMLRSAGARSGRPRPADAPELSRPVTRMAGWAGGASPARLMAASSASWACRPLIRTDRPPGSVTVIPRELARSGPAAAGSKAATVPVRPSTTAGPEALSLVWMTSVPAMEVARAASRHPVGPGDPAGAEAHHAAMGVVAAGPEFQRFAAEYGLRVDRRGRRAAGQLQGGSSGERPGCRTGGRFRRPVTAAARRLPRRRASARAGWRRMAGRPDRVHLGQVEPQGRLAEDGVPVAHRRRRAACEL